MKFQTVRSFSCSLLLHAAIAIAMGFVLMSQRPKLSGGPIEPLTLVASSISESPVQVGVPIVSFQVPKPAPAAREPAPTAREETMPVEPPTAPTAPERAPMSIDEFRRNQGISREPSRSPGSRTGSGPRLSETISFPSADRPTAEPNGDFVPALRVDLQNAFGAQDLFDAGLSAGVEFSVREDGALDGVRLQHRSGVADFDAAVLAAFKKVRARGFSSRDVGKTFRVTFRATKK